MGGREGGRSGGVPMGAGRGGGAPGGGGGGLAQVGGSLVRTVKHGPLTYKLTYDPNKWAQASTRAQEVVRQVPCLGCSS
jgi:hypothetical protein